MDENTKSAQELSEQELEDAAGGGVFEDILGGAGKVFDEAVTEFSKLTASDLVQIRDQVLKDIMAVPGEAAKVIDKTIKELQKKYSPQEIERIKKDLEAACKGIL